MEKQILALYRSPNQSDLGWASVADVYRSKNPVDIYEILYTLFGRDAHAKYMSSTFCKRKHESLKNAYHGYSFHCLTEEEMGNFIDEVSAMAEGAEQ